MENPTLKHYQVYCSGGEMGKMNTETIATYPVDPYSAFVMTYIQPVLSTCPLHTISGCGKERQILIGPW